MKKTAIIILSVLATSCGGGGNDSSGNVSLTQGFTLERTQSTEVGSLYETPLSGFDSEGINYTGSYLSFNLNQTLLEGIPVTPTVESTLLQDDLSPSTELTTSETAYYDANGNLLLLEVNEISSNEGTAVSCTPESQYRMPNLIHIGDTEMLPILICDDDTSLARHWHVEDAGNSNALLVTHSEKSDQFDIIISETTNHLTLNEAGEIIAYKVIKSTESPSYTLTYQSL